MNVNEIDFLDSAGNVEKVPERGGSRDRSCNELSIFRSIGGGRDGFAVEAFVLFDVVARADY